MFKVTFDIVEVTEGKQKEMGRDFVHFPSYEEALKFIESRNIRMQKNEVGRKFFMKNMKLQEK